MKDLHTEKVTIIRDKIVKKLDEAKSNKDVNADLEKQKEHNKPACTQRTREQLVKKARRMPASYKS